MSASLAGSSIGLGSLYTRATSLSHPTPIGNPELKFRSVFKSSNSNMKWCCRMTSSLAILREGSIALFKDMYVDPGGERVR